MRTDGVMLGLPGATILFVYKTIRIMCHSHTCITVLSHSDTYNNKLQISYVLAQNLDQSTCVQFAWKFNFDE